MGRGMKNKFNHVITKVLVVLAACTMFASFSPSLDGRAVVVDDGVFPQGLFAKTVGYLPGDIISVANITGETTVDLLVIGALDPSEGVAIMLSPEAADAIGIDKDANNIVKITKRSGQDERVYGTAVIAKQNYVPETKAEETEIKEEAEDAFVNDDIDEAPAEEFEEEAAVAEETEESEETPVEEELAVPEEAADPEPLEAPVEEEAFEEETPEAESEDTAEDNSAETAEDEETEETEVEEKIAEEPFEEEVPAVEETPVAEEAVEKEEVPELTQAVEEEAVAEEEVVAEEAEETEEEIDDETEATGETEAELEDEAAIEEEGETEAPEEIAEEPFVEDEAASEPVEEPVESELTNESLPVEEENLEEDELDAVIETELEDYEDKLEAEESGEEESGEEAADEETEEYEAIVLVPVDSNPPVVEETAAEEPADEEVTEAPVTISPAIIENVTAAPVEVAPVTVTPVEVTPVEVAPVAAASYDKYLVNTSDLKRGAYYIQIAVLTSDANIMEIVNKYSNNYPITIVPVGGVRKQVLIGALSMDEYAVVLERFKSYGYKDAFLRKIK